MIDVSALILEKLESYKKAPVDKLSLEIGNDEKSKLIYNRLLTKKFRKYAIDEEYKVQIKKIIDDCIQKNQPIPFVLVFGCYKLWRLESSPSPDWAELFSLMHIIDWLLPITHIHKPGVVFDFFDDGCIIQTLNGVYETDLKTYKDSFLSLLSFVKGHLPDNFVFSFHSLLDEYSDPKDFFEELRSNIDKEDKMTTLTTSQINVIKLNIKNENNNPISDEKIQENNLLFRAFSKSSKRRPYYRNENKIFVDSLGGGKVLSVGSCHDSVVRFRVGTGVIKQIKEKYLFSILSHQQISSTTKYTELACHIDGLDGPNFGTIKLIQQ